MVLLEETISWKNKLKNTINEIPDLGENDSYLLNSIVLLSSHHNPVIKITNSITLQLMSNMKCNSSRRETSEIRIMEDGYSIDK